MNVECGNWETEHYNYVLERTRPRSFISGNAKTGTRHAFTLDSHQRYVCRAQLTLIRSMLTKWLFDMAFFLYVF
jgi:hypothetical protein